MFSRKILLLKDKLQICMNGLIIALKVDLNMFILKSFTLHKYICLHELIMLRSSFSFTGHKNIEFKLVPIILNKH